MLIIPEDIVFKHVISSNVQYVGDTKEPLSSNGGFSCINVLNWPNYFY